MKLIMTAINSKYRSDARKPDNKEESIPLKTRNGGKFSGGADVNERTFFDSDELHNCVLVPWSWGWTLQWDCAIQASLIFQSLEA